jgi:hypothetical protein
MRSSSDDDGLDGYGGTLERIERELVELRTEIKKDFRNHDLILNVERITALEERR